MIFFHVACLFHSQSFYIYIIVSCLLNLVSHLLAGVDFKIKFLTVGGKKLKLTIWDTGELNTLEYGRYHFCFSYDIFDCLLEHTMLPKPICMQFYPYHMFFLLHTDGTRLSS
jgi:hypothetical protein